MGAKVIFFLISKFQQGLTYNAMWYGSCTSAPIILASFGEEKIADCNNNTPFKPLFYLAGPFFTLFYHGKTWDAFPNSPYEILANLHISDVCDFTFGLDVDDYFIIYRLVLNSGQSFTII